MKTTISKLTSQDLSVVDNLMKRYTKWLGFLPREALRDYLDRGGGLGAKTENGELIGYLLYAENSHRFRIIHLCVAEEFVKQCIARRLIDALKQTRSSQKIITLHCRRDFPAHDMWHKLGFVPLDEKPGRSKDGYHLTLWQLTLARDDQIGLFQATTSDETLDVIIDAQVFFDFDEPDSDKTKPSQALLSDFLVDSLSLWITDELFVEINRKQDSNQRQTSRQRAHEFSKVEHDSQSAKHFEAVLGPLFPGNTSSQKSDVRQLAKAAASNVNTFVTRDHALLKKSEKIAELTGLQVLSPTALIIQIHELSERQSYAPARISGLQLRWQRLTSGDLASFPFDSFLNHQETKGTFRENLESLLANPQHYECELLWSVDTVVAIRVLTSNPSRILTIPLARVARSVDRSLFGRFLIADVISKAVEKKLSMVKFEAIALTPSLIPDLWEMGFTKCRDSFVRFCFSRCLDRRKVLSEISELCPESTSNYQDISDLELERLCSPLKLRGTAEQNHFLIPIRPGYAMSLIDRYQSANHLFGGDHNVLLRWDNVYYRKKTHHKMFKAPGRILWYVSRNKKHIVAVSHLDAVVIDTPKALFNKFKKFGVLEWKDLHEMCEGDLSKKLMALQFSHTFLFREPVSLKAMRTVYNIVPQGPSIIPPKTFDKLFQLGYPDQP